MRPPTAPRIDLREMERRLSQYVGTGEADDTILFGYLKMLLTELRAARAAILPLLEIVEGLRTVTVSRDVSEGENPFNVLDHYAFEELEKATRDVLGRVTDPEVR